MTRSLKSLWDRLLFRDKGIVPTKRLLSLLLALNLCLLIGTFFGMTLIVFLIVNGIFLLLSLLDLIQSPRRKQLAFKRTIAHEWERGNRYKVTIEIENRSQIPIVYTFIDDLPQSFTSPFPVHGEADGETIGMATYETEAPIRGDYKLQRLYFRYTSRLGLWATQMAIQLENDIKVIPDLTETKQYLASAQRYLLHEGAKIRKYRSGSGEFAQIRSYVVGDDPRKINWRQTAKLQQVMANEYEPEHGKYITILIDCGRMMGAELQTGNRLERALEAVLTVAAAALQNGEYVSILAFSRDVKVYIPPAKGMAHLQTILQAVYHLEVDAAESNYGSVLSFLETMQKKRSLLLLFSDVRTFLHEQSALSYLLRLRRRHLFFMIGVEDSVLVDNIRETPESIEVAMKKSIAQQQMMFKKRERLKWERLGLVMIETQEEKLASVAVSNYIEMMNRDVL